jgi:hypothetical protein
LSRGCSRLIFQTVPQQNTATFKILVYLWAIEVFGNWAGLKKVLNLATCSGRKMESARDLEATAVAVRVWLEIFRCPFIT